MGEHSIYRRIIGPGAPSWTLPIRGLLRLGEAGYTVAVGLRNAYYDWRGPRHVLPLPVISVGNLTVGGTGKTPFVIALVHRLAQMGLTPAVVARGYKAKPGEPNDEERLIRAHCPGVVVVSGVDRAAAAEVASREIGGDIVALPDVIVLDDAFQHRRIARSLDIVLLDATCPFGYGHLLPRGLLREPVRSLRRAQAVVVTRADQATDHQRKVLRAAVRSWAGDVPLMECIHRVTSVERLDGTVVNGSLAGRRAVLFAGIARPEAFARTARSLGVDVVGTRWWPDHHHYQPGDIRSLLAKKRPHSGSPTAPYDVLLTTEKDAVKLARLDGLDDPGILVLKISIDFLADGVTILQNLLDRSLVSGNVK